MCIIRQPWQNSALSANSVAHLNSSYSPQMEDKQPLTHPLFATEEENNILTAINTWVFPIPMDPPPLPLVVQEEARHHQETDQLVCSTPNRPRWRMEDGEMVCVVLASSLVLQGDTHPLPSQATVHQRCRPDLLVCPPLPRDGGAGRSVGGFGCHAWLTQIKCPSW